MSDGARKRSWWLSSAIICRYGGWWPQTTIALLFYQGNALSVNLLIPSSAILTVTESINWVITTKHVYTYGPLEAFKVMRSPVVAYPTRVCDLPGGAIHIGVKFHNGNWITSMCEEGFKWLCHHHLSSNHSIHQQMC